MANRLIEDGNLRLLEDGNTRLLEQATSYEGGEIISGGARLNGRGESFDPGDSPSFLFHRPAVVRSSDVVGGPHTDFVTPFKFNHFRLATVPNGGGVFNYGLHEGRIVPYDFAIYSDSGLTTLIPFKIVKYDPVTGTIWGWLLIGTYSTTTTVYLGYGDPLIFSYQGDDAAVFTGNTHRYEFSVDGILSTDDSSGNARHGTLVGSPVISTDGVVDKGIELEFANQPQHMSVPGDGLGTSMTWSLWVKAESLPSAYNVPFSRHNGGSLFTHLAVRSDGKLYCAAGQPLLGDTSQYDGTGVHTLSTGTWYRLTIQPDSVASPSVVRGYVNGVLDGTGDGCIFDFDNSNVPIHVGNNANTSADNWDGPIDELVGTQALRSENWLRSEYLGEVDPEGHWDLDDEDGYVEGRGTMTMGGMRLVGGENIQSIPTGTLFRDLLKLLMKKIFKGEDFELPEPLWVSVHTADPGTTGANQVGSRAALMRDDVAPAVDGTITNVNEIFFNDVFDAEITHIALWDGDTPEPFAALLWKGTIATSPGSFTTDSSGLVSFPPGGFIATISECVSLGVGLSMYLRNKILDKIFRGVDFLTTPIYMSLHDGDCGFTGANELLVPGYRRTRTMPIVWSVPSNDYMVNNDHLIRFNNIMGNVSHVGFWDAENFGNFLMGCPIDPVLVDLDEASVVRFVPDALQVWFDTCEPIDSV